LPERTDVESLGVEGSLTPVPIEKGRIANLSVGFVENDPLLKFSRLKG
jgi:hypothetical protein